MFNDRGPKTSATKHLQFFSYIFYESVFVTASEYFSATHTNQ